MSSIGGGATTPAEIADAVWDELVAGHVAAGTVGNLIERLDLLAAGGAGELTAARAAALANLDAAISSRLASIKSTQRGTITITAGQTGTATISAVVTAKTMLRYLGTRVSGDDVSDSFANIVLTNTTTITGTVSTNSAGDEIVSWELTEFN